MDAVGWNEHPRTARAKRSYLDRLAACPVPPGDRGGGHAGRSSNPESWETESSRTSVGDLGPVYGKQWRRWLTADGREIDHVQDVIDQIRSNPASRRIIWDGWNVGELDQMALPPCHKHYQFFVTKKDELSVAVLQRSADFLLGTSWNILNAGLTLSLLAKETDLQPREVVWYGLDVHLYMNHLEQAKELIVREPRPFPKLKIKRESLVAIRVPDRGPGTRRIRSTRPYRGAGCSLDELEEAGQSRETVSIRHAGMHLRTTFGTQRNKSLPGDEVQLLETDCHCLDRNAELFREGVDLNSVVVSCTREQSG